MVAETSSFRLTGHLRIVCARGEDGRSFLREQSFRAPMHISKPYWEGDLLVVNAVNATAGLFSGDAILCETCVEPGASLLLTSPSAQRAHRMPEAEARVDQRFVVRGRGAFLEVWPELFIPQGGARYTQQTRIEVDAEGEMLFFEALAPGRVASGEVFRFDRLEWEMNLRYGGELVAREKYALRPGNDSLYPLTALFPAAYYGSCFAIGRRFAGNEECWEKISSLSTASVSLGCSRLSGGGWVVKILAATAPDLRAVLRSVRQLLYAAAEREGPLPRRT